MPPKKPESRKYVSAFRIVMEKTPKNKKQAEKPPKKPPCTITERKERNKFSAAKSRANRKAQYDEMARTIELLRLENAALTVQVNGLVTHISGLVAQIPNVIEEPCPWVQTGIDYAMPESYSADPIVTDLIDNQDLVEPKDELDV